MSKTKLAPVLAVLILSLPACAIREKVSPVTTLTRGDEVCIVHDAEVRDTVEPVIVSALNEKGLTTRVVPGFSDPSCAKKLTYTARWSWDLTIYMSKAELAFYEGGVPRGKAVYDSKTAGGFNLNKFVDAEEKLRELIDQLFPSVN